MNRIKELREERKLTVRKLEELMNTCYSTFNRYENESRDLNTKMMIRLAEFFDVSIDYLLGYSEFYINTLYQEGDRVFKLYDSDYKYFKSLGIVYFNDDNKRCINLNKFLGCDKDSNICLIIDEIFKINSIDAAINFAIDNDIPSKILEISEHKCDIITRELMDKILEGIRGDKDNKLRGIF